MHVKHYYIRLQSSTSTSLPLIRLQFLIYLRTIFIFSLASCFVSFSWQTGATSDWIDHDMDESPGNYASHTSTHVNSTRSFLSSISQHRLVDTCDIRSARAHDHLLYSFMFYADKIYSSHQNMRSITSYEYWEQLFKVDTVWKYLHVIFTYIFYTI